MDFYIFMYIAFRMDFRLVMFLFRKKEWVNRELPSWSFSPIYGSGAVMIFCIKSRLKNNLILTYFAGVVGATLLELVTGAAMEALLKSAVLGLFKSSLIIKDISVCPSVAWGFLTILMNEVLHPAILHVLAVIPKMADGVFVWVVSAGLAVDRAFLYVMRLILEIFLSEWKMYEEKWLYLESGQT